MYSNYQEAFGKKCCYFWFFTEVKFLTCDGQKGGGGYSLVHIYIYEYTESALTTKSLDRYITSILIFDSLQDRREYRIENTE